MTVFDLPVERLDVWRRFRDRAHRRAESGALGFLARWQLEILSSFRLVTPHFDRRP
jgi:hypothetical protein